MPSPPAQLPFLLLLLLLLLLRECAPHDGTDGSFVLVDHSAELAAIDPGCAEDEWRYGRWEKRPLTSKNHRRLAFRCRQFEYANATCGPPFSQPTFCAAAACRSILLVGDSLISSVYHELVVNAAAARDANMSDVPTDLVRWRAAADIERHRSEESRRPVKKTPKGGAPPRWDPGCSPSGVRESFSMCRSPSCPRGIRISFARHDFVRWWTADNVEQHLPHPPHSPHSLPPPPYTHTPRPRAQLTNLVRGQHGQHRYGRDGSSRCEGWHSRRTLAEYQVVVLGTGAHLADFGAQITNTTFHRARARRVAQLIHENAPPSLAVVFAKRCASESIGEHPHLHL